MGIGYVCKLPPCACCTLAPLKFSIVFVLMETRPRPKLRSLIFTWTLIDSKLNQFLFLWPLLLVCSPQASCTNQSQTWNMAYSALDPKCIPSPNQKPNDFVGLSKDLPLECGSIGFSCRNCPCDIVETERRLSESSWMSRPKLKTSMMVRLPWEERDRDFGCYLDFHYRQLFRFLNLFVYRFSILIDAHLGEVWPCDPNNWGKPTSPTRSWKLQAANRIPLHES